MTKKTDSGWSVDVADQTRRLNYINDLKQLDRGAYDALLASVDKYGKFKTDDQRRVARELIAEGKAVDADEAYSSMSQEGLEPTNDAYSRR